MTLHRTARHPTPTPLLLVRGHSRFCLRVCFMGSGLKPYGWEIYDEEDGRTVRCAPTRYRTSAEAWQAGSAVLDQHDTSEC